MRFAALSVVSTTIVGVTLCGMSDLQAQSTRCRTSDCFTDRDVRDFEILSDDTLVAYVGRDRCPYLLTVDPLFCDLRYLPEVSFVKTRGRTDFGSATRVCTYDLGVGLDPMGFSSRDSRSGSSIRIPGEDPARGAMFSGDLPCRLVDFRAISDDEIIELYVDQGLVAPPPPIGTGQISRADEKTDASGEEQSEDSDDAED